MPETKPLPIAILHEHPDWFKPLFAELDRRGLPWVRLDANAHYYDPSERDVPWSLVFNRTSPSAWLRSKGESTFHTLNWLHHLEQLGVPVVNGSRVQAFEISKARQLEALQELGFPYPRSRVINSPSVALAASEGLRFPVLLKANIGGSGAGITLYQTREDLAAAVNSGAITPGVDQVLLVQEYIPYSSGHITRVETLGGNFLYAINVYPAGDSFNLCPADICQTTGGVELSRSACALDAPKNGMRVEPYTPPTEIIEQVEQIARHTGLDVGGIEYAVDDRDGTHRFYDVNALSNFVADARNVVGFDPTERLVDYLVVRAGLGRQYLSEEAADFSASIGNASVVNAVEVV